MNPDFARAYFNRGYAYYELGQYDKELENYDKALEIDPDHSSAIKNRKILLEEHPELKP